MRFTREQVREKIASAVEANRASMTAHLDRAYQVQADLVTTHNQAIAGVSESWRWFCLIMFWTAFWLGVLSGAFGKMIYDLPVNP